MSYTPTTWENGDVITAEKLNHMEDGISNADKGALVVNFALTSDSHNPGSQIAQNYYWHELTTTTDVSDIISAISGGKMVLGSQFDTGVLMSLNVEAQDETNNIISGGGCCIYNNNEDLVPSPVPSIGRLLYPWSFDDGAHTGWLLLIQKVLTPSVK